MAEKNPVTLIQNANGQVVAVKMGGGAAVPVMIAGPQFSAGQINLTLTVPNVDFSYEMQGQEPTPPAAS
ncbi:hypothetical protein [Methylobacterium sp. ID0610]|uniref:hypothetical protein n=1 Tax=Methylobacterium carpenticola TaxID=3344827 RepID=UPI0036A7B35B